MKKSGLILALVAVILMVVAGAAFALEMSGTVSAVNIEKGTLTVKGEKVDVPFDCETGSMIKGVKVGDKVTVEYKEVNGMKRATKVTPVPAVGC
jgi:lipopolysaccharide export system protein LptA